MLATALTLSLVCQSSWLTPELVKKEAPWFLGSWHKDEYSAMDQARQRNRPLLIWKPLFPFTKVASDQGRQERLDFVRSPQARSVLDNRVEAYRGLVFGDPLSDLIQEPGVYVFLPDCTLVGSVHGSQASSWPKLVDKAEALIKSNRDPWADVHEWGGACIGPSLRTSIWFNEKSGPKPSLDYAMWSHLGWHDLFDQVFRTDKGHAFILEDLFRSCLKGLVNSDVEWREHDFKDMRIYKTGPRSFGCEFVVSLDEVKSGVQGILAFSHPEKQEWVHVNGTITTWKEDRSGRTTRTFDIASTPEFSLADLAR